MEFPNSVKRAGNNSYHFYASMPEGEAMQYTNDRLTDWRGTFFKATYGGGSDIGAHYNENGVSSTGHKRVYPTYNCVYCQNAVSIERTYIDSCSIFTTHCRVETTRVDPDTSHVTTNAYPQHHWVSVTEANEAVINNCAKFCFAACFNSFVGKGTCKNNCNNSCTGSTTTPTCNMYTGFSNTSSTPQACLNNCLDEVNCLQQCVRIVGAPCLWCVNDTTCNGCVFGCTTGCAELTGNFSDNCVRQSTKGHIVFTDYCKTCNGMTGHCNSVCNNDTTCASCTAGCTTECTGGCYTATVSGTCKKNCNTNCYGTCTESCTCGCTQNWYSGCANSNYSHP